MKHEQKTILVLHERPEGAASVFRIYQEGDDVRIEESRIMPDWNPSGDFRRKWQVYCDESLGVSRPSPGGKYNDEDSRFLKLPERMRRDSAFAGKGGWDTLVYSEAEVRARQQYDRDYDTAEYGESDSCSFRRSRYTPPRITCHLVHWPELI